MKAAFDKNVNRAFEMILFTGTCLKKYEPLIPIFFSLYDSDIL